MSTIAPTAAATTNYDCYDRLLPKLRAYYGFGATRNTALAVSICSVCRHSTVHNHLLVTYVTKEKMLKLAYRRKLAVMAASLRPGSSSV